jgi:hypothetical protein
MGLELEVLATLQRAGPLLDELQIRILVMSMSMPMVPTGPRERGSNTMAPLGAPPFKVGTVVVMNSHTIQSKMGDIAVVVEEECGSCGSIHPHGVSRVQVLDGSFRCWHRSRISEHSEALPGDHDSIRACIDAMDPN